MPKSLIYHYFSSKEDILYEVMASHVEALDAAVDELEAGGGPADNRLRALTSRFMELYSGAAHRQKVLLNELNNLPPKRRSDIVTKQRRVLAAVSKLLLSVQPVLKEGSHRLTVATMLFFGMINWTSTWFDPDGPMTAGELAELATDLILGGVIGITHSARPTVARPRGRRR